MCSRAGYPKLKKEPCEHPRNRPSIRCGCEWKIYAHRLGPQNVGDPDCELWEIVTAKIVHTNGCNPSEEQQRLAERARGILYIVLYSFIFRRAAFFIAGNVYPKEFFVQLLRQVRFIYINFLFEFSLIAP